VIPRFPLGQIVATPGALDALLMAGQMPGIFLRRHVAGDWGDIDAEDQRSNEYSLAHGFRLVSAYRLLDDTLIWVITEADRSSTCILLPSEY
jgi:hypothetical protein